MASKQFHMFLLLVTAAFLRKLFHLRRQLNPDGIGHINNVSKDKNEYLRLLRESSICVTQEVVSKVNPCEMSVRSLRNIIAYCILPPKDENESVLNDLVKKAEAFQPNSHNHLLDILQHWSWDGFRFQEKIDKSKLAQMLSELVQNLNRKPLLDQSSSDTLNQSNPDLLNQYTDDTINQSGGDTNGLHQSALESNRSSNEQHNATQQNLFQNGTR